jgi:hypothetical protein
MRKGGNYADMTNSHEQIIQEETINNEDLPMNNYDDEDDFFNQDDKDMTDINYQN